MTLLAWRTPRVAAVVAVGPLACCATFTLATGHRVIVYGPAPSVTNELDVERAVITIGELMLPFKNRDFSAAQLRGHAEAAGGWLQDVIGGKTNFEVGKLLEKLADQTYDGVTIMRIKRRWFVSFL